ncbi:MAG TPA: response regulator transcription factor [Ktedonosporobacter sp.]|jgi:two-component system secretion response regulator SsrB|nr:response regulator transcription factor [Ktedonosporobacter sp.]
MKYSILIAEPHYLLRTGLRTIFSADERVTTLYDAANPEELQSHLRGKAIDLIIVDQTLIDDITTLPSDHFVLLTSEFNIDMFLNAYKHRAKGYLLKNSQAEYFRALINLPHGAFLIDPTLTVNIMEYLTHDRRLLVKEELLTPREREIVELLREGTDRQIIAQQLNISPATLRTHIKNIFRKRQEMAI